MTADSLRAAAQAAVDEWFYPDGPLDSGFKAKMLDLRAALADTPDAPLTPLPPIESLNSDIDRTKRNALDATLSATERDAPTWAPAHPFDPACPWCVATAKAQEYVPVQEAGGGE